MSLKCFILLSRYLYFVDSETRDGTDLLGQVRCVVEYINQEFSSLYTSKQDIAIDESLEKFCRQLSFVQFNPSEKSKTWTEIFQNV
jgi:hypothetical protein